MYDISDELEGDLNTLPPNKDDKPKGTATYKIPNTDKHIELPSDTVLAGTDGSFDHLNAKVVFIEDHHKKEISLNEVNDLINNGVSKEEAIYIDSVIGGLFHERLCAEQFTQRKSQINLNETKAFIHDRIALAKEEGSQLLNELDIDYKSTVASIIDEHMATYKTSISQKVEKIRTSYNPDLFMQPVVRDDQKDLIDILLYPLEDFQNISVLNSDVDSLLKAIVSLVGNTPLLGLFSDKTQKNDFTFDVSYIQGLHVDGDISSITLKEIILNIVDGNSFFVYTNDGINYLKTINGKTVEPSHPLGDNILVISQDIQKTLCFINLLKQYEILLVLLIELINACQTSS